MHALLACVAVGLQGLLSFGNGLFPDAELVPLSWLLACISATACSLSGLGLLSTYGSSMKHPFFEQVSEGQPLTCGMLSAALDLAQLPCAVLAAIDTTCWLNAEALEDEAILNKLARAKTCVAISAGVMKELEPRQEAQQLAGLNLRVVDADFSQCNCKCGSPWGTLRWPLKIAMFHDQFLDDGVLNMLACCTDLEEVSISMCKSRSWSSLRDANWPELRVANFFECFGKRFTEVEPSELEPASTAVLKMLSRCSKLETLDITQAGSEWPPYQQSWEQLPVGCWPNLKLFQCRLHNNFSPDRLVGYEPIETASPSPSRKGFWLPLPKLIKRWCRRLDRESLPKPLPPKRLTHASLYELEPAVLLPGLVQHGDLEYLDATNFSHVAEWKLLQQADWPKLQVARFSFVFSKTGEGAAEVLDLLSRCKLLTVVDFGCCGSFPAEAWAVLRMAEWPQLVDATRFSHVPKWKFSQQADWPKLQVARFSFVFSKTGEGAAELLDLLSRCKLLTIFDFGCCGSIPAEAWAVLRKAEWPELVEANFGGTFDCDKPAADGAVAVMELLVRCKRLEKVNFRFCDGAPSQTWDLLGPGTWPELKEAHFDLLDLSPWQTPQLEVLKGSTVSVDEKGDSVVLEVSAEPVGEAQGPSTDRKRKRRRKKAKAKAKAPARQTQHLG